MKVLVQDKQLRSGLCYSGIDMDIQNIKGLLKQFVQSDFKDEVIQQQAIFLCVDLIESYFGSKPKLYKIYTSRLSTECRFVVEEESILNLTIEIYMSIFHDHPTLLFGCHCLVFAQDERIILENTRGVDLFSI